MKVNTRITSKGVIDERVFAPDGTATFNLEVPGTIASGDPIGTGGGGGGGGGGGSSALLEAYIGADTAALKVGVVELYTPDSTSQLAGGLYQGTTVTIHDVGNGGSSHTFEFVVNDGDAPSVMGAYPIPINLLDPSGNPLSRDIAQLRQALVDAINDGDTIFAPKAWSLKATLLESGRIKLEYTGAGGASGGEPLVADEMNVSFSTTNPFTAFKPTYFTRGNMADTSLNGRLSLVEHGDGCIIVPLTHVANGTWSDTYPVHPNGITVTAMSLCPHSPWNVTGANYSGKVVTLSVRKNDSSGAHINGDIMDYFLSIGGPLGSYAGSSGFPLAMKIPVPNFPFGGQEQNSVQLAILVENDAQRQLSGSDKIYVEVKSNDAGSTAPAAGEAMLAIFYRVNPT